jgi:hypothetical protein
MKHLPPGFVIPAQSIAVLRLPSRSAWVNEIQHNGNRPPRSYAAALTGNANDLKRDLRYAWPDIFPQSAVASDLIGPCLKTKSAHGWQARPRIG